MARRPKTNPEARTEAPSDAPGSAQAESPVAQAGAAASDCRRHSSGDVIVVKAKSARGRWRAGRHFTTQETAIPRAELSDEQLAAICADPELIVELQDA